jgi:predicted MPP superfamily phosphohydrolase
MRLFYLVLILMLALDVAWWRYADLRLRQLSRHRRSLRALLAVFMAGQLLLLLWSSGSRFLGVGFDHLTPRVLISATYLWHLIVLPCTLLAWIAAIAVTIPGRILRAMRPEKASSPQSETGLPLSRRQLLGATAIAATPPIFTGGLVAFAAKTVNEFRVNAMTLPIPNLPRDLDGLTIAHVTDIHVGRFTDGKMLRRIVHATNNLRSDLVLMTGDLINNALSDLPAGLDAVRKMDARFGIYNIEGNHDLFDRALEFERQVKASGIPHLIDEAMELNVRGVPLQLLGLRWGVGGPRPTPGGDEALALTMPRLLAKRRPDAFPILLAHHPHAFDHAAAAGVPLTLSGHTHGGQLMLTRNKGFGPMMYRYWSGLYTKGVSSLVVSNGVGNWFPLRLNAPAEIIHLTLRRT